jgi:SsrA-binding protein
MSKKKHKKEEEEKSKLKKVTVNKKAYHDYEIIEKFEAGMMLEGSEVKSLRAGRVNLKDSYIDIRGKEAFLIGTHISMYSNASYNNHEPERVRKLLLHKQELKKMDKKVKTKGVTIIPLQIFLTPKGLFKIEIALAKGKRSYDKKQQIKEKDIKREMAREMKNF